jgi:hypothetical protein
MNTDDLVALLARDIKPVRPHSLQRRLAAAGALGAMASAALLTVWLGGVWDLALAVTAPPFIFKAAYTVAIAAVAASSAVFLLRPGGEKARRLYWLALPLAVAAGLTAGELASTPQPGWSALLLGHSALSCLVRITALSAPLLIALLWAARAFAPASPSAAGAAIGLSAGSLSATVYSFYCVETASSFVALWYTAAIVLAGLTGTLLGSRILRW